MSAENVETAKPEFEYEIRDQLHRLAEQGEKQTQALIAATEALVEATEALNNAQPESRERRRGALCWTALLVSLSAFILSIILPLAILQVVPRQESQQEMADRYVRERDGIPDNDGNPQTEE